MRAKLVERAEDYPFSGSLEYSAQQILEAIQMRSG